MNYDESDFLMLSGIQHFSFCRRQWALIHIEDQWAENLRTTEGEILHERAHDASIREKRGDIISVRGVSIHSSTLGISGQCDVLEYRRNSKGVPIRGLDGLWIPYPVEYKRGEPKMTDADRLQLCAQGMCLEEMLCCDVPEGALFYGETRRREKAVLTDELRQRVKDSFAEMHRLFQRGYTPKVKPSKACNACSLKQICLPKLMKNRSASAYLKKAVEECQTAFEENE